MLSTHLDNIVKTMLSGDFYPHPATTVEKRETHISIVFLTEKYAYKIKKPVDLQFLNFTDLEKRDRFCREEVALNQRLSSGVYLEVLPITLSDQGYALNGTGEVVEYAVKMVRLNDQDCLDRRLRRNSVTVDDLERIARKLARFYDQAASNPRISAMGAWEIIWKNCVENFEQIEALDLNGTGDHKNVDDHYFQIIRSATQAFLKRHKHIFESRAAKGKIRDCHGDLKSEHVYLGPVIQIVDCIEFNERFRYSDICADLAFLAMDIDDKGHPELAQALIDAFLKYHDDPELMVLMTFYKCYRAMVRVKVLSFQVEQTPSKSHRKNLLKQEKQRLLTLAYRYAVHFTRPTVFVACGMPASGKSTLASALASALDLKVISSDITRKTLFKLDPDHSQVNDFESGIYSENATALTYGKLLLLAQEVVQKGDSVVIDATYSRQAQRMEMVRFCRDMDVDLIFIHCRAEIETLKKRLQSRESQPGVSDARQGHLSRFISRFEPMEEIDPQIRIEVQTETPIEGNLKVVLMQDAAILSRLCAKLVRPD